MRDSFDIAVLQDIASDSTIREQMRHGVLLDSLAREIAGDRETPVRLRQGVISAVDTASIPHTCSVTLTGASDTTPGARFFTFYRPRVNDVVWCLQNGPDVLVLGDLNPIIQDPVQFNLNTTLSTNNTLAGGPGTGGAGDKCEGTFYSSKSGVIVIEVGGMLYSTNAGVRVSLGWRLYEGSGTGGTLIKDFDNDNAARSEGTSKASMMWRTRYGGLTPNVQHFIQAGLWSGNGTQVNTDQRRILVEQVA